jgi:hypothetical protein
MTNYLYEASFIGQYSGYFFLVACVPGVFVVIISLLTIMITWVLLRFKVIGKTTEAAETVGMKNTFTESVDRDPAPLVASIHWVGILIKGLIWTLVFRFVLFIHL